MLHVVNYRGHQVHSPEPFSRVIGSWVIFARGLFADLGRGGLKADGVRVLDPGDDGYVPAGVEHGGLAVTDVPDGGVRRCAVCGGEAERECAACGRPLCDEDARTTSVPGDTFCRAGVGCLENFGA